MSKKTAGILGALGIAGIIGGGYAAKKAADREKAALKKIKKLIRKTSERREDAQDLIDAGATGRKLAKAKATKKKATAELVKLNAMYGYGKGKQWLKEFKKDYLS